MPMPCPGPVKEILFRLADRAQLPVTLVANHFLRTPGSRYIKSIVVPAGFDVADNEIVKLLRAGDLVITADIPLAAEVLAKARQRSIHAVRCIPRTISRKP